MFKSNFAKAVALAAALIMAQSTAFTAAADTMTGSAGLPMSSSRPTKRTAKRIKTAAKKRLPQKPTIQRRALR